MPAVTLAQSTAAEALEDFLPATADGALRQLRTRSASGTTSRHLPGLLVRCFSLPWWVELRDVPSPSRPKIGRRRIQVHHLVSRITQEKNSLTRFRLLLPSGSHSLHWQDASSGRRRVAPVNGGVPRFPLRRDAAQRAGACLRAGAGGGAHAHLEPLRGPRRCALRPASRRRPRRPCVRQVKIQLQMPTSRCSCLALAEHRRHGAGRFRLPQNGGHRKQRHTAAAAAARGVVVAFGSERESRSGGADGRGRTTKQRLPRPPPPPPPPPPPLRLATSRRPDDPRGCRRLWLRVVARAVPIRVCGPGASLDESAGAGYGGSKAGGKGGGEDEKNEGRQRQRGGGAAGRGLGSW